MNSRSRAKGVGGAPHQLQSRRPTEGCPWELLGELGLAGPGLVGSLPPTRAGLRPG